MSGRPTIKEVSRIAGVSFKTVSRVLNKEKHVSEETRRRVEEAVARLNFRPSSAARALAGRRSFQVALLYDNPSPYYIYHLQTGAQERCSELGFRLLLQPCDSDAPDLASDIMGLVDETHLDGLILTPPVTEAAGLLDALDRRGVRYVRIAPGYRKAESLATSMDDIAAACEMIEHLIQLGHRKIGFIDGPANHVSASERREGFEKALRNAGIRPSPQWIARGNYTFPSGREAALRLLQLPDPPTAIFAANDEMAAGAIAAAHELDMAVPAAVSVAGFDDSDLARAVWPPLTTVRQPIREMAYAAASLLLEEEESAERQVTLPHALVTRGTTAPPPSG